VKIKMSLNEIEEEIRKLDRSNQQKLLKDLLRFLEIEEENFAFLKVSEPSFDFWDNSEDSVYDNL